MLSVSCPIIDIAAGREMPARSRFLTAVGRKSCGMLFATITVFSSRSTGTVRPARRQAESHARRNDLIGFPLRWNTHHPVMI